MAEVPPEAQGCYISFQNIKGTTAKLFLGTERGMVG